MPIWGGTSQYSPAAPIVEMTADTEASAADAGKWFRMVGAVGPLILTLPTGLPDGWMVYVENAISSNLITEGRCAISATDADFDVPGLGATSTYSGDVRLVSYDQSENIFRSVLLQGGQAVVTAAESGNSYQVPTATRWHEIEAWGSGGGAGAGVVVAASTACSGGGGGGGGLHRSSTFPTTALGVPGTDIACTVAAGGQGGQTSGADGVAGGTTSFGTLLQAFGGGAGAGGGAGRAAAGGGGSGMGQGGTSASGSSAGGGGVPFGASGGGGGGAGGAERLGGAGGGGVANGAVGQNGGASGVSGGGGASGAGISAGNGTFNGGNTAPIFSGTAAGGGVAPGGNATAPAAWVPGSPASQGGPGGASATAANGGNGADGQTPAAGGGGGGSTQTGFTAGRGGNGGDGRLTIGYG